MRHNFLFLSMILVLAFALRFVELSNYPMGFSADEVNQGYSAYSILKTGRDEWGEILPLAPRAYGDYRAPLYTYLSVPFVGIFGLNEFAVRLPNVIIGTVAILVIYLVTKEFFKNYKNVNGIAIVSALVMAINPWHISMSRGAFETNLPSLLFPLGVLFFVKGVKRPGFMALSALVFGLSAFSYYSARTLMPIVIVILYFLYLRPSRLTSMQTLSRYKAAALVGFLFIGLIIYTTISGSSTRVLDVALFSSESSFAAVANNKYEAVFLGLPDLAARIFSNKIVYIGEQFLRNYLGYFSLNFLFIDGAGEATYGMLPGLGLFYLVELSFLIFSLYTIFQEKLYRRPEIVTVLALILIAPVPAALTTSHGFAANRAAVMLPWLCALVALGIVTLVSKIKYKKLVYILGVFYAVSLVMFIERYFFHAPMQNSRSMSFGWKNAAKYLSLASSEYSNVVVSRSLSEPQMFLAFYLKIDPRIVQKESADWLRYQTDGLKFVDQLGEYKLANFTIRNIDKNADILLSDTLLLGKPEDFSYSAKPVYSVNYPDGKAAMYFVSTKENYVK